MPNVIPASPEQVGRGIKLITGGQPPKDGKLIEIHLDYCHRDAEPIGEHANISRLIVRLRNADGLKELDVTLFIPLSEAHTSILSDQGRAGGRVDSGMDPQRFKLGSSSADDEQTCLI